MIHDDQVRAVGKIISISANKFEVEMQSGIDNFMVVGFDDVHYVARLGALLLVPVHAEYVVVEIVGLRESESVNSSHDNGIGKERAVKYLDVEPIGMLSQGNEGVFSLGITIFPSLYTDVLYFFDAELDRVLATNSSRGARSDTPNKTEALTLGQSVTFENYNVKIRTDEFFGDHSAVLGSAGSGKSCTIATILQELLSSKQEPRPRGATFIVFDVNGEYNSAFSNLSQRWGLGIVNKILDGSAKGNSFLLPHWLLDYPEWEKLLQADGLIQASILRTALGLSGLFQEKNSKSTKIKQHIIATYAISLLLENDNSSVIEKMQRVVFILERFAFDNMGKDFEIILNRNWIDKEDFPTNERNEILSILHKYSKANIKFPSYSKKPFTFSIFDECLEFAVMYEEARGNPTIREKCSSLIARFKSVNELDRYAFIRGEVNKKRKWPQSKKFLSDLLGLEESHQDSCAEKGAASTMYKRKQIVILDMNAIDAQTVELVSSAIARITFEALRNCAPRNCLPVHFILEEAHRYLSSSKSRHPDDTFRIFDQIAKDGRKCGLFLIVVSQRPSEISNTVLSQCSNFIIHRVLDPDDLKCTRKLNPFISEAVLNKIPSIPNQHALIFGTSVNLPLMLRVREANPTPTSVDVKIGVSWFHAYKKNVDIGLS